MSKPIHKPQDRPAHGTHVDPDEEIVHVPKGQSRLRFVLTLGLTLFVLVIFTVGDQLMTTMGQRPSAEDYVSWVHPTEGPQSVSVPKFMEAKRALDEFSYAATGGRMSEEDASDGGVAYQLITERIAQEAGVEVPDVELGRAILEGEPALGMRGFLNRDTYLASLEAMEVSPQAFEATLRRVMRVRRYEMLVATSLSQPLPADIEKVWKEQHQEYAFELAGVAPADVRAEAEASLPDDEGLKAWYEGLNEGDKARLFLEQFLPVRTSAELVSWTIGPQAPQALLDRYPRPETPTLEELTSMYHARFGTVRFPQTQEEPPAAPEGEQAPTPPPPAARPLEEVREQAAVEAQVHAALDALLRDVRSKAQAGETIDLAALAAELGLEHENDGTQRSNEEWNTDKGSAVRDMVALAQPGQFALTTAVDAERITIVRAVERKASEAPPFETVAEVAATKWVDERAKTLAEEKLEALREKLDAVATKPEPAADAKETDPPPAPVVDAETFAREVEAAGLKIVQQEWFDPAQTVADMDALPEAERFLRFSHYPGAELFSLSEGAYLGPLPSAQDERQWLVRSTGKRDPAEMDIRPSDYESLSQRALFVNLQDVILQMRSVERLERDFKLRFPAIEAEEAERAKQTEPVAGD
jgi:hypothetical protein